MKTLRMILTLIISVAAFAQQKSPLPVPETGDVTLTLEEYNKLVELARKPPKKPDIPPVNYSLKRAELKLRVESESVMGSVQLQGEVFKKGVTKVPLSSGITVLDARQEGKGVPLQNENGTQVALLSGPSEFAVALNVGLRLGIETGRASFSLPVPSAGTTQLSLSIPGEHAFVNLSPGLITSRSSANGQTSIEAVLVPGQQTNIWWATRESVTPTAPKEVRFLSDVKSLVSVGEAELRIAALADVTIVQGEPSQFEVEIPAGYEVTSITGASLDSSEVQPGVLILKVNSITQRGHQFLISMERSISESKADVPFLSFKNAQRETGELLVEGVGTMELTAKEGGSLKRMDLKEVSPYLRSLSRNQAQAAFRFHRQPNETPTLALEWTRFPDSSVLAALAESAQVTTMVTSEGKSLTEVKLTIKNQAQPFLKVALPAGASILSADVAGEKVKPVQGADGSRVPLLRPGFRPSGPYEVSFVFMHSGAPFAKKGGSELSLPSMDVPINLLHWEVFLPEQYKVKDFGGDVISADLVPQPFQEEMSDAISEQRIASYGGNIGTGSGAGIAGGVMRASPVAVFPGQVGGVVTDPSGAAIPGARITVTNSENGYSASALTDQEGRWIVSNFPAGRATIKTTSPGFKGTDQNIRYDASRGAEYATQLNVGATAEMVTVEAEAAPINGRSVAQLDRLEKAARKQAQNMASANVVNLQRRVAGVLPVAIDVPRTGTSFQFVRPLVLSEETKVTFSYKSK